MSGAYDSRWQTVRRTILERDHHLCQINGPRCKTTATEVDHIIPLIEGGPRLDHDNLRAACRPCNAGRQNTRLAGLIAALTPTTHGTPSRNW